MMNGTSAAHRLMLAGPLAGVAIAGVAMLAAGAATAQDAHVAFGDIATVESLNFLIAIERAKERGVEIEVTFFNSEDIAAQAVVSGEADIGVGTPYALLQQVDAPIRLFYQMSNLRFYPVVNSEVYQDWADLDGEEITVHSRGSGTEAIMNLMAQQNGIEYSGISYVPGSEVRAGAMLQGTINASIVDSANWRLLEREGGGRFVLLPIGDIAATDEALYANVDFLEENHDAAVVLIEELLNTWREIADNPAVVTELRDKYGLLADLPPELEEEMVPYYQDSVDAGVFPLNGGSPEAVQDDFAFYTVAGQLEGDAAELKVEDFWTFGPLEAALANVGTR
jgi:NitT/TauT family transport system substrate-binding protein